MIKTVGVILAGGAGRRFSEKKPKQYFPINGKEVISYVINAFKTAKKIDEILIVAHEPEILRLQKQYGVYVILGGNERNETIGNALNFINKEFAGAEKVVFADSVRPLITDNIIDDIVNLLDDYDAVITTAKITDSLGHKEIGIVNRDDYYLIQTPEAFKMDQLTDFDSKSGKTAIIQQINSDKIFYYNKMIYNLKITFPKDLLIAEAILGEDK